MAYTKYSLTPANNTAAPPDGAPEGMLPSAVNDTMRDMMAQIRDCVDGIRDGTYTMTAAKITGGTITGVAFTGNTFTSPVISGGSINNTPIGATTANTGAFTTLSATGVTTVQAGTNSAPAITTSGDTNTGIFFPAADTIAFTEGGVESMRVDSSGNVGIGTSSPSSKLHVAGTGFVSDTFQVSGTPTTVNSNGIGLEFRGGSTPSIVGYSRVGSVYLPMTNSASLHTWDTSGTERMRITSGGDVFVGNTTGSFSTVNGALIGATGRFLGTCTNDATIAGSRLGTDGNVAAWYKSTSLVGSISVTASATAYNTSSDYRLKENIAPMTGALNKVAQLKPVTYTWKSTGEAGQGFIAHELAEIVPDAVTGEKDAVDAEGKPIHQGVDTSFLVATLTAAIQELNEKVEAQAAEIALLKSK